VPNSHQKGGILVKDKFGKTIVSGLALAFAICVAASANAATLYVGSCALPSLPTIQAAVTASATGGVVKVCPGTYPEQVTINKSLTLEGIASVNANQAVISAPATLVSNANDLMSPNGPIAAQILVEAPAVTVNITNLVVDASGSGWDGSSSNLVGIYYQNASGLIDHVVTRHQESAPTPTGSSVGFGIFAEAASPGPFPVTVENSSVYDFGKNGIVARGAGAKLTATLDMVHGNYPNEGDAENGIEIAYGATGSITNNTLADFIYGPCDSQADCTSGSASGILLFEPSAANVTISLNHVSNTQGGINVYGVSTPALATITSNWVDGTLVYDGIDLCGYTGGSVGSNRVDNSAEAGIHLDGTCGIGSYGATVSGNIVNEACAAYLNGTGDSVTFAAATTTNAVSLTLPGDTATCTPPMGGDARTSGQQNSGPHVQP
jgi:hypothetical protein